MVYMPCGMVIGEMGQNLEKDCVTVRVGLVADDARNQPSYQMLLTRETKFEMHKICKKINEVMKSGCTPLGPAGLHAAGAAPASTVASRRSPSPDLTKKRVASVGVAPTAKRLAVVPVCPPPGELPAPESGASSAPKLSAENVKAAAAAAEDALVTGDAKPLGSGRGGSAASVKSLPRGKGQTRKP